MILNLKRYISLLLVLMLLIGIIPKAYAAELPTDSTIPEETVSETVETTAPIAPTDPTDPTEPTGPPDETTEPTAETEPVADTPMLMTAADDYGIMTAASTQSGVLLFDYADNGNYTSSLNSQITVGYKWNGTGSTKYCYLKNFGWHFARINNVPYADDPLYCIEPHRDYAASMGGNSVDRGVTMSGSGSTTGSNVWYSLNADRREAIGLILLYSNELWDHSISVTTTSKANNPNVPLRMATQFLIFEIICGLRDAETFALNSSNECGYSGDIFYNAGTAAISYFAPNYNQLVTLVQAAMEIPSFTSGSSSTAPTITLDGEETSVYDSNGVLSDFSFTDKGGAEFYKSGNTLYITQTGTISESTVHTATKYIPSAVNSTYNIYYMSGSTYQTTISLYSPSTGSLNAYFKLKAPASGALNLKKNTEDNANLAGWKFGIYANQACTTLLSGPHTTDANGNIQVTGLTPGTVYVKELGHTNSTIASQYVCTSTNPQKVTIANGSTATVTFNNDLAESFGRIIKKTADGKNLGGWKFNVYSDEARTQPVTGSPFTTPDTGIIDIELTPGDYWVQEVDESASKPYWNFDTTVRKLTVTAGQTASITFTNVQVGYAKLVKETNTGADRAGRKINIYTDEGCTDLLDGSPFVTGEDGTIDVRLTPGNYWCQEVDESSQHPYWVFDNSVKKVSVKAGETATVTFTNTHYGRGKIIKSMPDGGSTAGWVFDVYRVSEAGEEFIGACTTGDDGTILTDYLLPGTYKIVERIPEGSPYICEGGSAKTVAVEAGQTAEVTFVNIMKPGEIMLQKTDSLGNPLAGAEFMLEWSSDGLLWYPVIYTDELDAKEGTCTSEGLQDGKLVSGVDGIIRFTGLNPGSLYRLTETKAPEGFELHPEPVFEGSIQVDNEYFVQLTVPNYRTFELPMTGSIGGTVQNSLQLIGAVILLVLLVYVAKKRRK